MLQPPLSRIFHVIDPSMETRRVNQLRDSATVFDRRLKLELHGLRVGSDAGLLAYRALDDALGLTAAAGGALADSRTGWKGWHGVVGLLHQSIYGRLAGYENVNDADRLGRDPTKRLIVGGRVVERGNASTNQMGRFETALPVMDENLAVLADLPGAWIERVHDRHPPTVNVLDMDRSVSPSYGEQGDMAHNGHFGRKYGGPAGVLMSPR